MRWLTSSLITLFMISLVGTALGENGGASSAPDASDQGATPTENETPSGEPSGDQATSSGEGESDANPDTTPRSEEGQATDVAQEAASPEGETGEVVEGTEGETGEAASAPGGEEPTPAENAEGEARPTESEVAEATEPEEAATAQTQPEPEEAVLEAPAEPLSEVHPADESAEDATSGGGEESDESRQVRQGGEVVWSNAMPFRGTTITYENIFNVAQLNRGYDLTYNPYYAMSVSVRPRWYFTNALSLRLRFDLETELTNADDTTNYHETRASDFFVDLVYNPVVTIPGFGIDVGLGIRAQLPTSLQSQAETRYMGLGAVLYLSRVFDVLDGFQIFYSFRYMKYLNRQTTLAFDTNPYARYCNIDQADCEAYNQSGQMSRSHGFFNNIGISLDFLEERFRRMSLAFNVLFVNYLTYDPTDDVEVPLIGGGSAAVPLDPTRQQHRASIWYIIELSIQATDYLNVALGASTYTPQLAPDSTYREPIFNRYTNIYLDLSLDVERLVATVRDWRTREDEQ